jgi:hypothetical protein
LHTQLTHSKFAQRDKNDMFDMLQGYNAEDINKIAFYFSQQTKKSLPFDPAIDTSKNSATFVTNYQSDCELAIIQRYNCNCECPFASRANIE